MTKHDVTLVFIHRKAIFPVNYASEHAARMGYRVVVVGEEGWDFRGCENLLISDFDDDCEAFRDVYVHSSPNNPVYETFCFERWIILRNLLRQTSMKSVIYVDSDALVFNGIEEIYEFGQGKMLDTPYLNFFNSKEDAELVVDEMMATFQDPEARKAHSEVGLNGIEYYTDMLLFPQIARKYPERATSWPRDMELRGFDTNINLNKEIEGYFPPPKGIKKLTSEGDCHIGISRDGKRITFRFLHFQGHSKPLMDSVAQIG